MQRTNAKGIAVFKRYLEYADTGKMDVSYLTGKEPDSPFEESVADALRNQGYQIQHQIGCAGFFIDLAVIDPDKPGRYLLGIECDGASYHSARTARDRDRLRQDVLENLGWKIHRIWSTDWFQKPDKELKKVLQAIESAKVTVPSKPSSPVIPNKNRPTPPNGLSRNPQKTENLSLNISAYQIASPSIAVGNMEFHQIPKTKIAGWIRDIVNIESPVHEDEVLQRIMTALDKKRSGARIREAFDDALFFAVNSNHVIQREDFLWSPQMQTYVPRDRSALPTSSKKVNLIAPEELEVAIALVTKNSIGIEPKNIAQETCRLLGFKRVTEDMRCHVQEVIDDMLDQGKLVEQGKFLMVI
ncbi:MAG: DUF3320 domain-containing protein [SAR324 cluster bacterium]|nr:DUF3320 domain-containing protein [SAR324 cluster bacterium]